jgi:hypothetical protein
MTEKNLVSSPSLDNSQEHFCKFEKKTRGISSKLLKEMGCDGQVLRKKIRVILSPIVVAPRVKHEGPGFNGKEENCMTMKTTFVKTKDMIELTCSSKGREAIHEGNSPLPPHPSYGKLKKGSDEESANTRSTLALRGSGKSISQGKNNKKNTKRSTLNKESRVFNCCKKRGHNTVSCWYSEACSFCGRKGHQVAYCWEKASDMPQARLGSEEEWDENSPIQ